MKEQDYRNIFRDIQNDRQKAYEEGMRKLKELDLKQQTTISVTKQRKYAAIVQSLEWDKIKNEDVDSTTLWSPQTISNFGSSLEPKKLCFMKVKLEPIGSPRNTATDYQESVFTPQSNNKANPQRIFNFKRDNVSTVHNYSRIKNIMTTLAHQKRQKEPGIRTQQASPRRQKNYQNT